MTAKDYVAIAREIAATRWIYARDATALEAIGALQYSIGTVFADDNPRFDRERFDAAANPVRKEAA